jgi:hypothetical protein
MIAAVAIGERSRAVAWNPRTNTIVAGLGGDLGRGRENRPRCGGILALTHDGAGMRSSNKLF